MCGSTSRSKLDYPRPLGMSRAAAGLSDTAALRSTEFLNLAFAFGGMESL